MNRPSVIAALISAVAVLPCGGGVIEQYGRLPLYFIENQGQLDSRVHYYVQGRDKSIYFTPDGVTFALSGDGSEPGRWSVKLSNDMAKADMTVDVTPRRCQKFKVKPGEKFKWTNSSGGSGTVTADKNGLVTVTKVKIKPGAETTLTISR